MITDRLKLGKMPFYFKVHDHPNNGGFPQVAEFDVSYDANYGMYRQVGRSELRDLLARAYSSGSLVEGSLSNSSGSVYLNRFVDYISNISDLKHSRILEIGCGNGVLMAELEACGAKVLGIDPGNHQRDRRLTEGSIICDCFPSQAINDKFNLIVHFGVLEHIEEPVSFLRGHLKFLEDGGRVVIAVPNCQPYLEAGDISMFIHEHYGYFTKDSLRAVAALSGLKVEDLEIVEGMLVAVAVSAGRLPSLEVNASLSEVFEDKLTSSIKRVKELFLTYDQKDVAVYAPMRAMNALYCIGQLGCRLVDDSPSLHGKYLPAMRNPIEPYSQILAVPPKCLLIYSRTFGSRLKEKCQSSEQLSETDIISLEELDG